MQATTDNQLKKLHLRRLLDELDNSTGEGATSMISLVIPAGGNLNRTKDKISTEIGDASCIKSRV